MAEAKADRHEKVENAIEEHVCRTSLTLGEHSPSSIGEDEPMAGANGVVGSRTIQRLRWYWHRKRKPNPATTRRLWTLGRCEGESVQCTSGQVGYQSSLAASCVNSLVSAVGFLLSYFPMPTIRMPLALMSSLD